MPSIPADNSNLHCQIVPSSISDDEFRLTFEPNRITFFQRIGQILLFIFTFGLLRFILAITATLIYMILVSPVAIFPNCSNSFQRHVLNYGIIITRCYIRLLLFFFGIVWISKEGEIESSARNFVFNHTSALDGPLLYIFQPFSVVCHIGLKSLFYFGRLLTAGDTVFVDRSHHSGNSQKIKDRMEDHSKLPVAIAPEGKISNGTILFNFRTGGFLANEVIQPVTIRYNPCYTVCGCTYNWLQDSAIDWIFGVLCIPFATVHVSFLKPIQPEDCESMTPQKKAEICQIDMANHLGVLAITRSAREIFEHDNTL